MNPDDTPPPPPHTCTCGCGLVIGDGDWAHGTRSCRQLRARLSRLRPRR